MDELVKTLRASCDSLDSELSEERRQRYALEDLCNNLKIEISEYRGLNNTLLEKNEQIVSSLLARNSEGKEKFREAEVLISDLSKHLQTIRTIKIENHNATKKTVNVEVYENALIEKRKVDV